MWPSGPPLSFDGPEHAYLNLDVVRYRPAVNPVLSHRTRVSLDSLATPPAAGCPDHPTDSPAQSTAHRRGTSRRRTPGATLPARSKARRRLQRARFEPITPTGAGVLPGVDVDSSPIPALIIAHDRRCQQRLTSREGLQRSPRSGQSSRPAARRECRSDLVPAAAVTPPRRSPAFCRGWPGADRQSAVT